MKNKTTRFFLIPIIILVVIIVLAVIASKVEGKNNGKISDCPSRLQRDE